MAEWQPSPNHGPRAPGKPVDTLILHYTGMPSAEGSLRWLCDQVGLDVIGAWWFGADAMDLFRSCRTRMHQLGQPAAAIRDWEEMMAPLIDGIQETMDRHRVTSEVHFMTKVRR